MGTITMVASSKDGIGKSTCCVLLADALAATGKRVLVLELDSGLRSLDIIAGVYGHTIYDILDVLSGKCDPEKAIVKAPAPRSSVYVLSAPYRTDALQGHQFVALCNVLGEQFDHVLIDTASLNGTTLAVSAVAMNALLIATADPICVRDSRILYDRLQDLWVPNIRLILNRVVPARIEAGVVANLDYCIDNIGAQLIGVIPESTDIALAASRGTPLNDKSIEAEVFRRIARRMHGDDAPLAFQ